MGKPRRFPKALAGELSFALSTVRDLGSEQTMELLARFRRNRVKYIATWGLFNTGAPVENLESILPEHHWKLEKLDEAFQKLHHYKNGGAEDYAAIDVERMINSQRAKQPRKRANDYRAIYAYLQSRGYESSVNKKALVADAESHFEVSESTIRRAIRDSDRTL